MKSMLKSTALFEAFVEGGIGTKETYPWWTTLWGLRSGCWSDKRIGKQVRKSLGDVTKTAIEEGNFELLQALSNALAATVEFEREPEKVLRANIYFGIFELNASLPFFTRSEVIAWLKQVLEIEISAAQLATELASLTLASKIPDARNVEVRGNKKRSKK